MSETVVQAALNLKVLNVLKEGNVSLRERLK